MGCAFGWAAVALYSFRVGTPNSEKFEKLDNSQLFFFFIVLVPFHVLCICLKPTPAPNLGRSVPRASIYSIRGGRVSHTRWQKPTTG